MADNAFILPSDLKANYNAYREDIRGAALRVLDSGWYIGGTEVTTFEEAFAQFIGTPAAVGVASGTDALSLALRVLGIGPGDIVITVSHTAVATVAAIELVGAKAALIDIDPATFVMDAEKLRTACEVLAKGDQGVLKAVIPVHLYGHPADMTEIMTIAKAYGLRVVEDCAQAHGAKWHGQTVGTWGDIGTFSFYPTKNLGALGDAGALVTRDPALAEQARLLKEYGWRERYISYLPGMNTRLDPLQAAILSVKLKHLADENAIRRRIASRYDAELADTALVLPTCRADAEHVYHQYVIRHPERNSLQAFLKGRQIGSLIHYPMPVHQQPAYAGKVMLPAGPLPETEAVCAEILSLPIHAQLTDEQQQRTIAAVREWLDS